MAVNNEQSLHGLFREVNHMLFKKSIEINQDLGSLQEDIEDNIRNFETFTREQLKDLLQSYHKRVLEAGYKIDNLE